MINGTRYPEAVALALTMAVVAFVGAIVVLTIPYAIFTVPLPPGVNPVGLSVETTQRLPFGPVWFLLVPASLFAGWVGYKVYQWGRQNTGTPVDDKEF
jgi:hypothetical protein